MEQSGMQQGRMFSNMATTGMLGLEMPLHSRQPPTSPAASAATTTQMVDFSGDHSHPVNLSIRQQQQQQQQHQTSYPPYKQPHPPSSAASDDDEPGGSANDDGTGDNKRKGNSNSISNSNSPWHRMKWTDTMVKLLIMAVYYIGDDAGAASSDGAAPDSKRAKLSSSAAAAVQKKGKWKSVSRAMMEKGHCVSPQQCEDKFNDLNKRYKRVNDILGRGTACRVVENQTLLESMELSPKLKEEVKKLLNSKHLFFREMCAYHNSCGHANAATTPSAAATTPESDHHLVQRTPIEEEEEEEEEEDDDDDEEEEVNEGVQLKGEMVRVMGDGSKSVREKRQWVAVRAVEVEEQGLKFQREALEIEKQRMKWAVYSTKKEREMERSKLENERRRLENQRMLLLLRHKELEFVSSDA